ncbi:hypothetical protein IW140_000024 [Coemansia sp. RSA 1813]|nr:hypothetical protein IW140_000024 [Coemansia sp. RSA 1813]
MIEHETDLSEEVMDSKPRNGRVYPVLFFGSLDYAWITPENLEPYEENLAKYGSKAKNRKDPSFSDALKQAQDPTVAEAIIRRSVDRAAATDDNDVEMNSSESEAETTSRRRPAAKREQRNGRGRKATISNKRTSIGNDSSGDEANVTTTPKRSRTVARVKSASPEETPKSSAKREESTPQPGAKDSPRSETPSRHHTPENTGYKSGPSPSKEDAKSERSSKGQQQGKNHGKPYYFLMQIRHKLQKTVIKCDAPDDLASVDELFRKLEDFDMTLELIQETKLGKVMRIIASSDKLGNAPDEKFDIKGRARRLAEKWRRLITRLREGSAELATPESPVSKSPDNEARSQAPDTRSDSKSGKEAANNDTAVQKGQSEQTTPTTKETFAAAPSGESSLVAAEAPAISSNGKSSQPESAAKPKNVKGDGSPPSTEIGTNGTATASATNASTLSS